MVISFGMNRKTPANALAYVSDIVRTSSREIDQNVVKSYITDTSKKENEATGVTNSSFSSSPLSSFMSASSSSPELPSPSPLKQQESNDNNSVDDDDEEQENFDIRMSGTLHIHQIRDTLESIALLEKDLDGELVSGAEGAQPSEATLDFKMEGSNTTEELLAKLQQEEEHLSLSSSSTVNLKSNSSQEEIDKMASEFVRLDCTSDTDKNKSKRALPSLRIVIILVGSRGDIQVGLSNSYAPFHY